MSVQETVAQTFEIKDEDMHSFGLNSGDSPIDWGEVASLPGGKCSTFRRMGKRQRRNCMYVRRL